MITVIVKIRGATVIKSEKGRYYFLLHMGLDPWEREYYYRVVDVTSAARKVEDFDNIGLINPSEGKIWDFLDPLGEQSISLSRVMGRGQIFETKIPEIIQDYESQL